MLQTNPTGPSTARHRRTPNSSQLWFFFFFFCFLRRILVEEGVVVVVGVAAEGVLLGGLLLTAGLPPVAGGTGLEFCRSIVMVLRLFGMIYLSFNAMVGISLLLLHRTWYFFTWWMVAGGRSSQCSVDWHSSMFSGFLT